MKVHHAPLATALLAQYGGLTIAAPPDAGSRLQVIRLLPTARPKTSGGRAVRDNPTDGAAQ